MAETAALVILPTYNEAGNLPGLVAAVLEALPGCHVLVVDDASPDGTGAWAAGQAAAQPRLHLLARPAKLGLGSAYRAGWRWGLDRGHDPLVTMDADWSHHPRYLPALVALLEDGADLGIGSRYVAGGGVRNWGLHRRLLSRGANLLSRLLLRLPARDATAGFRAYRASCLRAIGPEAIRAEGYSFLEESLWRVDRAGKRVAETPILFEERRHGRSKIDRKEILRAAATLLRLRFSRPDPLP
ncbi:MAG: polyprenol monophosphomannose synthase [Planctomycetes bacterium]|nr:polyprenol monophosphomannose synthase [Planctomycetota bacterium]